MFFGAFYAVVCRYVYRCIDTSRQKKPPHKNISDVNDPFGENVGCAIFPALSLLAFDRLTLTRLKHTKENS